MRLSAHATARIQIGVANSHPNILRRKAFELRRLTNQPSGRFRFRWHQKNPWGLPSASQSFLYCEYSKSNELIETIKRLRSTTKWRTKTIGPIIVLRPCVYTATEPVRATINSLTKLDEQKMVSNCELSENRERILYLLVPEVGRKRRRV